MNNTNVTQEVIIAAVEGDLQETLSSFDIIEHPPLPMNNTNVTQEVIIYSILSTNLILEDEKRATRKKTIAYTKAGGPFIVPQSTNSLSSTSDLAACLLIKDDNDILSEWIAYHYHALNLRFLIVAVDPHSIESPTAILEKWKLLTDLEFLEWNDEMFMPQFFLQNGRAYPKYVRKIDLNDEGQLQIQNHRYRQRVFLSKCLKESKQRNRTWTVHIDTDEFVVPSKIFKQVQPDYVQLSPIEEPGSVLNLLKQVTSITPTLANYPCISLMRLLFGSVENNHTPDLLDDVTPDKFNVTEFETLRWIYHAPPVNYSYHGHPKVIMDVSAIPDSYFSDEVVFSIHRPLKEFCKAFTEPDYTKYYQQPLAANHYLGSWERYSGRNDSRRSREVYDRKNSYTQDGVDNGIQRWLQGFVDTMGERRSEQLLSGKYLSFQNQNISLI